MKKFSKRHLFLILTAVLVAALVPVCSFILNASAAQITSGSGTWISGMLTYTYSVDSNGTSGNGAAGSVSASGSSLVVKATNSKEVSGCSTTAAEATTTTVTVTNASSYPLKIKTLTNNGGTINGVSQGDVIAPGATFTIIVTAPAVTNSTQVTGGATIEVEEQTSVTITLAPSPYVGYTVNNHTVAQNGSEQTFTTDAGTSIALPTITAPSGYEFKGWRIGSSMVTGNSFTANGALTVFPVIVSEGVDITAANFKVNNATYTFWEDAVNAAIAANKPIFVNLEEVTLPDNVLDNLLPASGGTYVKPVSGGGVEYILPGGVTLVLPYSTSTTVHTTTPAYGYKQRVTPSAFRTLYLTNGVKMTVNGSVCVDSYVSAYGQSNQGNGTPSGPHGMIVMRTGSEMTLNSGAFLYCWGFINGDGHIYLNSGAKVYELFQFCDWRGGNGTKNINGNSQRVFPMSQYYVQNVEAPMTLYKGATEMVWSVVNMSSSAYPTDAIEFIGSNGMFKLTGSNNDYITKRYHANVDRLEIAAHGNMTMNNLTVSVSGLPLIGTLTMNSASYVLPLNNMEVVVETGTTSIASGQTYGVEFLPSSKLTVNEGATFTANAPVYFYDAEDWGWPDDPSKGYCGASNLKLVVSGYSTANGTTTMRTAVNLEDAEMNVNGTVNVSNKIYTTEHGARITSSEGTGRINFTSACATGTAITHQATQSGTDISYVDITVNNAELQNGDGSYQQTVGTGTSTWYYDKDGENWYRYKVDMLFNGSFVARGYYCELNDTLTYDASWLTNLGASVTSGSANVAVSGTNVVITDVTANSQVTLTGVPAEYAPTFVLNEAEYAHYQMYTGNTISNTTTIGDDTYYIVDQGSVMAVGSAYAAPTDAAMGKTAENHNDFLWNLSGVSFTSGDPYRGTVPVGPTAGGPAYIYGFYDGAVAYNSYTDAYYRTLKDAFIVLPQDVTATITLLADCGTFEEESGTTCYATYDANNITLDLNGHHAVGRIAANGTFTLELNGGTLDFVTGATAPAAAYKGLSAIVNNGTMVIQDSVGGGVISCDAMSTASGVDGSAVIRNNAGATLTITGKDSEHKLRIYQKQAEATYSSSYGYYAYNYGIYNPGTITALTYVDVSSAMSRSCSVNIYNYNAGVIDLISDCHMFSGGSSSVFNYGGTITMIDNLTADGKTGITNRNLVTGTAAEGKTVTDANKGVITTIQNSHIEVGSYAISNHAVINTVKNCTLIAHPDSAQVDTRGDGLSLAVDGNTYCYTVYNSQNWYYDTNLWKQTDSSSGGYTRVNYYREEEQYRPTIGTIENCEIYAEITSTSASHGYALVNYGVINKIGGTTNIKVYKHPDNAKISVAHYGLHNLGGGIIKSIEGTVNVSATGVGAVYNDGVFTTQINYTYSNKVGGILTHQKNTYGQPSTINSITCAGTWSCGGSNSYYYALYNTGYIQTINSTGLTLTGGCNVLYNATNGANKTYEITKSYTDAATASTEYMRVQTYVKNLEKGSTIGTINGITVTGKGSKSYYVFNNQGHIGTLSNTTVNFASGATANTSYYVAFLNGDSRYQSYTETIQTNRTPETDPHLTVTAGVVTRYDRDYTYATPTIDTIDNLTVNSITAYAFRNAGAIGTLKNSTITGTQYALHNYASGPYTERQTLQYYSGTSIFATTKYTSEYSKHYERGVATINLIDNCTITTPANTYAMFNSGHVGTIKNSTLQAGTTTAKAYALWNGGASTIVGAEREYTCNLADYFYVTANGGTSCTAYWGSGGETKVVTYDYDVPTIDLIGEGNTFQATSTVIANTGVITAINSGTGTLTTVTGTSAKGSTIYNYSACLDARTTTTPYTAATAANASGTAGTAVNDDTLLSGAQIGTIKNVYINANGYGILNGDATAGKLPVIGEIGEGTEIYAHCTTAGYHAIANQNYAEITSITGGIFTVTKATTNAYRNGYSAEGNAEHATLISGGDFKGMANNRDNAIYLPNDTSRQTYPAGYTLSSTTETVTLHDGTTAPCYFIAKLVTVSFNANEGTGTMEAQSDEQGKTITLTANAFERSGYSFSGWNTEADGSGTPYADEASVTLSDDLTLYAQWTENAATYTVTWKNGDTVLKTDTDVAGGTVPTYSGETPTKAADATYHYTFSGWDPTPAALSDDAVYTAQFTQTAHTWNDGTVTTAATCTTDGVKTLTCTVCGQTKTEAISALGHDMVTDAAVAATCTENGLTEGSHCSRCDYAVAQETVPALGHDIVTDAAVAATCTETGLTEGSHCSRCDYAVAQTVVPALGHDIVTDAAVAATCTETGLTAGEHCTRCDYAVAQQTVPALGHDMITDAAVAATCTETGLTEGSHCSRCEYAVAQTEVPALGHDWDDGTPAFGGGTTYTCKRCGATKWQGSGGMVHIHVPVLHEAVQATCTEPGNSAYYSCTGCDKYFSDEECKNQIEEDSWVIPPQHTLEFVAYKAPTCVEDGNEAYYICTAGCDKFFSDENAENEVEEDSWVIPATGEHVFVDGFCTMCGLGDGTNTAFKIASAKLTISNDIVVVYSAAVPENMTDPYMVFTFNGKDYRVESKGVDNKNRPTFAFEGVTPEKMGDNICAKLYATTAYGQTACVTKENYSVREYCVNSMNKYQNVAGSDKLMTLLTDILVYGATAQQYTKYHTDALVTEGVDLSHATEFTTVTETKLARTGEEDAEIKWVSASLQCGSQMAMVFTFTTTVPEVTTVEVTINGRTSVYTIPESRVNSNGTYSTTFTGISATEFDDTVTAVFKKDGVQVGQTLTYSVNSYVYSMQDNDTVPYLADLVKAIYNYGASARAYAGK